jgi:integrase
MRGVADQYLKGKDASRGYAANLRRTAGKMDAAGITPATIDGTSVSNWLSSLRDRGLSSVSISSERRSAITLWKFAIEEGMTDRPIRGVLKPRVARRVTRAFRRGDLTDAVKRLRTIEFPAFQSGCPRGLWIEAWILYVYETGARFTDAYNLRRQHLVPGGVAWTASKTGQPVVKRLSPGTEGKLSTLLSLSPDDTVFQWAVSRRHAFASIKAAFREIGLEGGRTQWLRRSGATHAEIAAPGTGAAKAYLGHATHGLAEKHYIDHVQLLPSTPAPPSLD